jgi:hypothetical protein
MGFLIYRMKKVSYDLVRGLGVPGEGERGAIENKYYNLTIKM